MLTTKKTLHRGLAGFTLIELMLVILVVALISVYAVQLINQSMIRSQINRAASQIESIKQVCTNYYINHQQQWPTSGLQSLTPSLLPVNAICSPFASATGSSTDCASYAEYMGSVPGSAAYYQMTLQLASAKIADQLVAAVPNSWIPSGSTTTVNIAISPPADIASHQNHGWIATAGAITTFFEDAHNATGKAANNSDPPQDDEHSTNVVLPPCGPGFEGHVLFFPEVYQSDGSGLGVYTFHIAQITTTGSSPSGSEGTDGYGTPSVPPSVYNSPISTNQASSIVWQIGTGPGPIKHYATSIADDPQSQISGNNADHVTLFMTICVPNPEGNGLSHWATQSINSSFEQDGQCSAPGTTPNSWQAFNNYTLSCNVEGSTQPLIVGSPNAD